MTDNPEQPKSNNFFDTSHLVTDLKGRSVRGGVVTLFSQVTKFIIQLSATMILARLLVPDDYGLVAMVTAITSFAALFKDLGLSMATIRNKEITHQQVSTLFWINVGISLLVVLILFLIAPFVSRFYNEPRLTLLTFVLASTFIFSGFTVQHQALLRRQMKFKILALIEICSIFVGAFSSIIMAFLGAGYWSLVGMPVCYAVTNAILVWFFCPWKPGLIRRDSSIRSMLKFGSHITGFRLVNYFSRNLDNILIGRFWGTGVLGLYSKAYSLMMLPISQIRGPLESVAMPALSQLQDDQHRYRRYYLKMISLLAFFTMPMMTFLFVFSDEVILLLLGANWTGAIEIFKVLCIVSFIQPVTTTRGLVLISLGKSKKYFWLGSSIGIITSISFVFGLSWGGGRCRHCLCNIELYHSYTFLALQF